jgi:hypothetical protein
MRLKPLEKVWIQSNQTVYPGIVIADIEPAYIVLKFDTVIWRRVICMENELSHRKNDFSEYMFSARRNFLPASV